MDAIKMSSTASDMRDAFAQRDTFRWTIRQSSEKKCARNIAKTAMCQGIGIPRILRLASALQALALISSTTRRAAIILFAPTRASTTRLEVSASASRPIVHSTSASQMCAERTTALRCGLSLVRPRLIDASATVHTDPSSPTRLSTALAPPVALTDISIHFSPRRARPRTFAFVSAGGDPTAPHSLTPAHTAPQQRVSTTESLCSRIRRDACAQRLTSTDHSAYANLTLARRTIKPERSRMASAFALWASRDHFASKASARTTEYTTCLAEDAPARAPQQDTFAKCCSLIISHNNRHLAQAPRK